VFERAVQRAKITTGDVTVHTLRDGCHSWVLFCCRLLEACDRMPKLHALLKLALITGARIGELLDLQWEDCQDGYMTFWQTKNGRVRRHPHHGHDRRSPGLQTADSRGRGHPVCRVR